MTFEIETQEASYLLDLPDPPIDSRLQLVQEGWVLHFVAKVGDFGLLPALIELLGNVCDDGVDEQADLRNLNVLLQVKKAHLQLSNLFLHGGSHLITISGEVGQR